MVLGSTQPLTEMSTRSISWGKGGRCVRLTTLPPSCAVVMKSGNRNFLAPSGHLGPLMGLIFFTHFCKRLSEPQCHSAAERITSMKNSSDKIGNKTRDLPACSAVPQLTAPPCNISVDIIIFNFVIMLNNRSKKFHSEE